MSFFSQRLVDMYTHICANAFSLVEPLLAEHEHRHKLGAVTDRQLHEPQPLLEHDLVLKKHPGSRISSCESQSTPTAVCERTKKCIPLWTRAPSGKSLGRHLGTPRCSCRTSALSRLSSETHRRPSTCVCRRHVAMVSNRSYLEDNQPTKANRLVSHHKQISRARGT